MFYDIFEELCRKKGISPQRACIEIGKSRSLAANWKSTGSAPNPATLKKIAEYFEVSTDYLLHEKVLSENEENFVPDSKRRVIDTIKNSDDEELIEILDDLRNRPEMKMLFHSARGAKKEQIEAIVNMIDGFKK